MFDCTNKISITKDLLVVYITNFSTDGTGARKFKNETLQTNLAECVESVFQMNIIRG